MFSDAVLVHFPGGGFHLGRTFDEDQGQTESDTTIHGQEHPYTGNITDKNDRHPKCSRLAAYEKLFYMSLALTDLSVESSRDCCIVPCRFMMTCDYSHA